MERSKILEGAPSAVAEGLRHRGYLKSQVTPQLHSLKRSVNLKDAEVVLELIVKAGKQYRVKDMTFAGLSTELPQADLRQAFNIQRGDIADGEEIGVGIANLRTLFQRKGKDVYVIPNMTFDDAASTAGETGHPSRVPALGLGAYTLLFAQIGACFADAQSAEVGTTPAKANQKIFFRVCDGKKVIPLNFRLLPETTTRGPGLNLNLSCPPSRQQTTPPWKEILGPTGAPMFCGTVYEGDVPIRACIKG